MRRLRLSIVSLAVAGAVLLPGCKSPCRQLSEKLCECAPNTTEKQSCIQQAASREALYEPTPEQQNQCAALLDKCDCHLTDTAQGKRDCGLAR